MNAIDVGELPTAKPLIKPSKSELSKALSFCKYFVSKLTSSRNEDLRDELVQEGLCSFLKAYKKFDQTLGYSVLTYTVPHMKGDILRAWNKSKSPVNITFTAENLNSLYNLSNVSDDNLENQRRESFRNIMNSSDVDELLDDVAFKNPYLSNHNFQEVMERNDLQGKVKKILNNLKSTFDECDLDILENRIFGYQGLSVIAKRHKMSAEGIRKKEARIITSIKLKFKGENFGS